MQIDNLEFYAKQATVEISQHNGRDSLRYTLLGYPHYLRKKDLTLKYAFPLDWKVASSLLKERVRDLLVSLLDISHFQLDSEPGQAEVIIPLRKHPQLHLLPTQDPIEVPIVVKLIKRDSENHPEFQLKCRQLFTIIPPGDKQPEQSKSKPSLDQTIHSINESFKRIRQKTFSFVEEKLEDLRETPDETASKPNLEPELTPTPAPTPTPEPTQVQPATTPEWDWQLWEKLLQGESLTGARDTKELSAHTTTGNSRLYSGIISIDFGTTNSVIVVRDPRFAAEEIKEDLGQEQWNSLSRWLDTWLIEHLSSMMPNDTDLFIEELTRHLTEVDIPPCGSLSVDIQQELNKFSFATRRHLLEETIAELAIFPEDPDQEEIHKDVASELLRGFENCIYSRSLEGQRYFLLELDPNAGPGPISSTLQIISAPHDKDEISLQQQTQVEMGVRVNLLMRSATMGDADINQFSLSAKRYFGRNEIISLVPSEALGTPVEFHPNTLCFLAYKELIKRAMNDVHNQAKLGKLQDADDPYAIVATFPTTYPASLRRKLRDLLQQLGIQEVDTRFDEGSASLIYYVWREVCADPICGMHGLMARCRVDRHARPYQNILLYDIGGGTTDIALIQLIYEIVPVFEPIDKTESEGGCYFRITPRLLGSTGHRYIGGDLITLWLFRLIKTKLADWLLAQLTQRNIEPPIYSPLSQLLATLEEDLLLEDSYRPGALCEWTLFPLKNIEVYQELNQTTINRIIPTNFQEEGGNPSHFFTLWHLTEEAKKYLGTPLLSHTSGLGKEWPEKFQFDSEQLWMLLIDLHPWLEESELKAEDISLSLSQEEMTRFAQGPIRDSLTLALNLAQARLEYQETSDCLDRLILSGFSCNMKVVQQEVKSIFQQQKNLFQFSAASVFFEPQLAKTSVAMGACIGRYLESVRLHPQHEKTRQMLREGYDQVELVVENLFSYLTCRLVYDSLVAMVTMFNYGQELNKRSYLDGKAVARTPMNSLRPVQEKFWLYRVDFDGAEPMYLGVIDAEAVAMENNVGDFRRFRENYVVGFETDVELFVRAFFLPRGSKNILAKDYLTTEIPHETVKQIIRPQPQGGIRLSHDISSQELFDRRPVLKAGTPMVDTLEYPDGSRYRCAISSSLPIREMYDFYIEELPNEQHQEPQLVAHFHLNNREVDEVYLACDERGKLVLLFSVIYDIKIWADIDYLPQKIDMQYDPFCGFH